MSKTQHMAQLGPVHPLLEDLLGFRPSPATVWRWHRQGIRTPDGGRVRLNVIRVGGKLLSSRKDVLTFVAAQQSEPTEPDDDSPRRSPETERQLREAGLLT